MLNFRGASRSTITGFTNLADLDINLSGASESDVASESVRTTVELSGASTLRLSGAGTSLTADLSGASSLQSFSYPVRDVSLSASGASKANVSVSGSLVVDASGASKVRYRGTPIVNQRVSGASTVQSDL